MTLDLAASIALGGDCLADVAVLREQPRVFDAVASDPTVSRFLDAVADAVEATALDRLRTVRAVAREQSWRTAGRSPETRAAKSSSISMRPWWWRTHLHLAHVHRWGKRL